MIGWVLFGAMMLAILNGVSPVGYDLRLRLAAYAVDRFGFLDVYLEACSAERLEAIARLRHHETDFRARLIEFLAETHGLPELVWMVVQHRRGRILNVESDLPNLSGKARHFADGYIDAINHQLWHSPPQELPFATRRRSRWRRRQS